MNLRSSLEEAHHLVGAGDLRRALVLAQAVCRGARGAEPATEREACSLIARCLTDLGEYARGRAFHQLALKAHEAAGDVLGVASAKGGIALCLIGQHETARGAELLWQAILLCQQAKEVHAEIAWRLQYDHVLELLDRPERRIAHLSDLITLAQQVEDHAFAARLRHTQAETMASIRDARAAMTMAEAAAWALDAGEPHAACRSLLRVADLHPNESSRLEALTSVAELGDHGQVDTARKRLSSLP